MTGSTRQNGNEAASEIAVDALAYVAGDATLMTRFLDLSGIDASAIRAAAREPGFLAGVLRFIAAHEPTLVAFAEQSGHRPEEIMKALRSLPGGDDDWMGST